jgi:hypothetical protein
MTLRWIARDLVDRRGYHGLLALACPVIIRNCERHRRFEWYDPINKTGGIARSLQSLQAQLRKRFYCRQCGLYHVDEIAIVIEEDFELRKYRLKEVWFSDFIDAASWEEVMVRE